MGNKDSQPETEKTTVQNNRSESNLEHITAVLVKLFEKLELTQDEGKSHPGELLQTAFENAFQGPLHSFGKLLYKHMMTVNTAANTENITREQFVKAGKEILRMHEEKQLIRCYFHLFSEGKDYLTNDDAKCMFEASFALTLSLSKILYQEDERDTHIFGAMVAGLFDAQTEVSLDAFSKWLDKSCPHLFHSVHNWILHVFTSSSLPQEMEEARVPQLEEIVNSNYSTSLAIVWLLSIMLPLIYTKPPTNSASASQGNSTSPSSGADPMMTSSILMRKMARLPEVQGWKLLYSSNDHGLSINRFNNHVTSYNAPTVTFITFEGGNVFCLAVDRSWLEGPNKFGGGDCRLIQLLPVYRVVQAGEKMVLWNESTRGIPKGISIGCAGRSEVLHLSHDFDSILFYNAPYAVHKIEVWGCGADYALQAQRDQKDWEGKAVQKERSRKLRLDEDWQNSPDKQILQWGGVNVGNHSYKK